MVKSIGCLTDLNRRRDMSESLRKAIEELQEQLEVKLKEAASLKLTINMLAKQVGEPPPYEEAEPESIKTGKALRSDVFFGKSAITASREFLEYKHVPCKPEEILEGLTKGGFDFENFGWKDEKVRLR